MEKVGSHIKKSANMAAPSDPAKQNKQRRRKFTIQSTFGQPRERRSRKSRPCDACRKRKTACVIQDKPPCNFCQSRGIDCISSGIIQDEAADGASQPSDDVSALSPTPEYSPSTTPTDAPLVGGAAQLSTLPSPAITSTPALESPFLLSHETKSGSISGVDRRPSSVRPNMTVATLTSRTGIDGLGIWPANGPGLMHTLEDNINKTAHFMGPTAEQDTYVLDLFRYMIISEKDEIDADYLQVSPGDRLHNQPPVHFLLLENETPAYVRKIKDDASDAIESTVYPHADALVRLYFKYVHPVLPVVSKVRFLRSYALNKPRIPPSLRGAVYMLACAFWGRESSQEMPCPMQQHELLKAAESSLAVELRNPNLANLQACLLLLHIAPPWTDTIESPTISVSASRALSCAQTSGLHKTCDDWNIEEWEKKLRKRLWWATYNTDCWASLCHGNPPNISSTSYSTSQLELEDMRFDEDVPDDLQHLVDPENISFDIPTASRFLETTSLSLTSHQIIDLGYQINPFHSEAQALPGLINYHHALAQWPYVRPPCTEFDRQGVHPKIHNNSALHLLYYTSQVLLYRTLTSPVTKEASKDPNSNLGQWFPHALHAMDQFVRFMQAVTEDDLEGFWGASARSQLMLCGNFLVSLFIVATREQDIQRAHELLVSFHVSLQRLTSTEYYFARVMLRPVALRIDSFFQQAGEIIRRGGHGYWQLASLEVMKSSPVPSIDRISDDA